MGRNATSLFYWIKNKMPMIIHRHFVEMTGFEPAFPDLESGVIPLYDIPRIILLYHYLSKNQYNGGRL